MEMGRGSPVVLVHGLGNSALVWRRVMPELARRHRVAALDLPGFGHSAPLTGRPVLDVFAGCVAELAEHIGGGVPVALVGNSVGGAVVARVARERLAPVARIVLVDPADVVGNVPPWWKLAELEPALRPVLEPLLTLVPRRLLESVIAVAYRSLAFSRPDRATARSVRLYARRLSVPGRLIAFLSIARDIVAEMEQETRRTRPPGVPALIVWGRQDRLVPVSGAARIAEAVDAVGIRIIENCGHSPQLERPEEFLEAVAPFLASRRIATRRPVRGAA
jgi:pimeloyl-ACP methyl ester carboxylesterase